MRSLVFSVGLGIAAIFSCQAQDDNNTAAARIMVSAGVNYGMRIADNPDGISSQLDDYITDLKKGISYDISAHYMINERLGVGLKYNAFNSSNSLSAQEAIAPNGDAGVTNIEDNITISFYGATLIYNLLEPGVHNVFVEGGLGYIHYHNDAYVHGNYTFNGGTIGLNAGISYQYEAFKGFLVGPKLSLYSGAISTMNITGPGGYDESISLDDDMRESLTRIDAGIIAAYRF